MSKTLNKYIAALDYADRTLLVLSGASSGVSLCSFATAEIAGAIISVVLLAGFGILKMYLKKMGRKKTNPEKLFCWPEVNSITYKKLYSRRSLMLRLFMKSLSSLVMGGGIIADLWIALEQKTTKEVILKGINQ